MKEEKRGGIYLSHQLHPVDSHQFIRIDFFFSLRTHALSYDKKRRRSERSMIYSQITYGAKSRRRDPPVDELVEQVATRQLLSHA